MGDEAGRGSPSQRVTEVSGYEVVQQWASVPCTPKAPFHSAGRTKSFWRDAAKISGATTGAPCGLRLSLCTYNCRSLSGADRLNYLMEEKKEKDMLWCPEN
ncbi:hypothetical protein Tcan_17646 [Toxocara canis]|uniref:Uncharacterized protein n=1 Tax=Toxocara canis TaxID=6265 RepID=A0A0B2UPW8_TOXCA|nr:hypothetical protein Tcan_17646 [Toxocara canis]